MRFTLTSGILLGLLVAQFPLNKAGLVPANLDCGTLECESANNIGWSLSDDLARRAGGGGGGKGGGGKGGDAEGSGGSSGGGGGGSGGGGNGSPQTEGGQVGEAGGWKPKETVGGFGDPCHTKRNWFLFWKRIPGNCNSNGDGSSQDESSQPHVPVNNPASPPANAPVNPPANAPSPRNNFGNPAQSQQQTYYPAPQIDIAARVAEIRQKIQSDTHLQNGPWFFWSGFENKEIAFEAQDIISARLGVVRTAKKFDPDKQKIVEVPRMPAMGDVIPMETADVVRKELVKTGNERYFWSAISRAYAQAITGRAYVVIPKGRPINIPKDNGDGSVWWSFEAPDLSRNPGIDSITYVSVDPELNMGLDETNPKYDVGPDMVIWQRGDEALGTPGNELYKEVAPPQPWSP